MSDELLINVSPTETRTALIENGAVQEVYIERTQGRGYVGNIYKGKIVRVLPGMQAAFVNIGLERTAFIHASDIVGASDDNRQAQEPHIRDLVREGQTLVVQVTKDPIGTKGARLTTQLSIPARYLVYMPYAKHIGISAKIENELEREQLRERLEGALADREEPIDGGFIVRTVAEGITREELDSDIHYLSQLWKSLKASMSKAKCPSVIYEDLPLYIRALRDLVKPHIEKLRIDSREAFNQVSQFAKQYALEVHERIEHYPGERPLFDLYGVEEEIQKALNPKVTLKSGGYLIIEQTEAMVTIDVNTGAFVGSRNLEETIFKTNLEAATTIARQLRLRNLGGIIILDFIDMQDPEHQQQVLKTFERALQKDYAKTSITGVSELGLIEMTRKRTRESLEQLLCESCPVCKGTGRLKSSETICYEIFREVLREARAYDSSKFIVLASPVVIDRLLDEESSNVADLEEFIGRPLEFQVEDIYHQEQYDIILV